MNPCYNNGKDCLNRTSTCHADCENYFTWKAEQDRLHRSVLADRASATDKAAYIVWIIKRRRNDRRSKDNGIFG